MTVQDLIDMLNTIKNKHRVVVLSRDSEGNGYGMLYNMEDCYSFNPESGEIGLEELTDKLRRQGFSDEDVMEDGIPALVLWP